MESSTSNASCLTHPRFARKVKRTSQTSSPRVSTRREGRAFKKREVLPFQMKTMTSGNCDFPLDAFSAFRSSFEKLSFRSLSVFPSFHLSVCLRAIIVGGLFYATLNFPPARAPCCNFACGSSRFKDIAELILRLDGSAAARRRCPSGPET